MDLSEELELGEGQRLLHRSHSTSGARGNIDVDVYDVLDAAGRLVEQVTVREEMDPHPPFLSRRSVVRSQV